MNAIEIMYVRSTCADESPETCGHFDRNELRVISDGRWLCEICYDARDKSEPSVDWANLLPPPEFSAAPTSPRAEGEWQSELQKLDIVADICMSVAELPDRTSPEDRPDMMLVTHDELQQIVTDALAATPTSPRDPYQPVITSEMVDAVRRDALPPASPRAEGE